MSEQRSICSLPPTTSGAVAALMALMIAGCAGPSSDIDALSAEVPLHLEAHLDDANVVGSQIPDSVSMPIEWRFDEPQPDWRPAVPVNNNVKPAEAVRTDEALRINLSDSNLNPVNGELGGGIVIGLPNWDREDWAYALVEARTADPFTMMWLGFNLMQDPEPDERWPVPFVEGSVRVPLINDGFEQVYMLPVGDAEENWEGPWRQLGIWFSASEPGAIDILSVRVVSQEAEFAAQPTGVKIVKRGTSTEPMLEAPYRRSIFMHTPGSISYQLRVPRKGRLDVGLGVVSQNEPVTSAVSARRTDGTLEVLLEATHGDRERWQQHSLDLSHLQGETVTLEIAADAAKAGSVALWSHPTVSGMSPADRPNVIFYIIDGGGADYMSVYGYHRRTTPNLERIAAEGAVFERAHSNASWTLPSTATFMTSLHHSVLGGLRNRRNPVPEGAMTMAEHMHRGGYLTAQFTSNSYAGRISGLERGMDVVRDFNIGNHSVSTGSLHEDFWQWREAYPAEPYWVHFQSTDVHNWHHPEPPFSGLFISPERRRIAEKQLERARKAWENWDMVEALERLDIDPVSFWAAQRDLHDETMAHQDHQLGRLVARLKAGGQWRNTLLIVAADHSVAAGAWDYDLLMREPVPPHVYHDDLATPMMRSGVSRIPLIVVWPGRIEAGQRISQPVSMIDMLPTILDLAGLPKQEVTQGRSLAPLLFGDPDWVARPVILDEFEVDPDSGDLRGRIEIIDGRWGASLQINPDSEEPEEIRPVPLFLFDLWNDPECLESLHDEYPELVSKYTLILEERLEEHQNLARHFGPIAESPLSPEQLETLQALGYVQ